MAGGERVMGMTVAPIEARTELSTRAALWAIEDGIKGAASCLQNVTFEYDGKTILSTGGPEALASTQAKLAAAQAVVALMLGAVR